MYIAHNVHLFRGPLILTEAQTNKLEKENQLFQPNQSGFFRRFLGLNVEGWNVLAISYSLCSLYSNLSKVFDTCSFHSFVTTSYCSEYGQMVYGTDADPHKLSLLYRLII